VTDRHPDLPPGDPVWAIYTWRADSITLTRLRPIIEEITVLADEPCLTAVGPYTCLNADPNGEPIQPVCLACRLKQLRARLYGYRSTPDQI
jgi:hypothetical protein